MSSGYLQEYNKKHLFCTYISYKIKEAAVKKFDDFINFAWYGAAYKRKDYNLQMKNAIILFKIVFI